jgi:hypothetical protein
MSLRALTSIPGLPSLDAHATSIWRAMPWPLCRSWNKNTVSTVNMDVQSVEYIAHELLALCSVDR